MKRPLDAAEIKRIKEQVRQKVPLKWVASLHRRAVQTIKKLVKEE
jgi:hypothetical protein